MIRSSDRCFCEETTKKAVNDPYLRVREENELLMLFNSEHMLVVPSSLRHKMGMEG